MYDPTNYQTPTIRSTLQWLAALADDPHVRAPVPVPSRRGELLTVTPEGTRAVVLTWVPGRRHGGKPRGVHFERLGRLMARLHEHARSWRPPPGFALPAWDEEGLMGGDGFVGVAGDPWIHVPDEARAALKEAREFARRGMRRARSTPMVIHADLHLGNVVFADGEARPFDFDDAGVGHPEYDWAAALSPYRFTPEYIDILRCVERGYGAPAGELDAFHVARRVGLALWVAAIGQRPGPLHGKWRPHFDRYIREMRPLLD